MCDTESNSILSTSMQHMAAMQNAGSLQQQQPSQQSSPAPYDLNAMNIVNAVPAVVTSPIPVSTTALANGLTATSPLPISAKLFDEIATENYWLREKMKEITADRDRLLCEVANLRLELDMAELKRLPEDRLVHHYKCCFAFHVFIYFIQFPRFALESIKLMEIEPNVLYNS